MEVAGHTYVVCVYVCASERECVWERETSNLQPVAGLTCVVCFWNMFKVMFYTHMHACTHVHIHLCLSRGTTSEQYFIGHLAQTSPIISG